MMFVIPVSDVSGHTIDLVFTITSASLNAGHSEPLFTTIGDSTPTEVPKERTRKRKNELEWNEFDFGIATFRLGGGYIHDFVTYAPNDKILQQMDSIDAELKFTQQVRDFRVLGSGKFDSKRPLSYKFAFMYDAATDEWLVRETGLIVGIPELHSQVFIGRTKEGLSMPKIMNGHSPWGIERSMAVDLVPIIADGIKWFGYDPKSGFLWNLAGYNDFISHEQKFSTFAWQYLLRAGWMKPLDAEQNRLIHLAGYYRFGKPENEVFRARSRPESNPSPYFIDTGEFPCDRTNHYGVEAYYSHGRWMAGTEWYSHHFNNPTGEDHVFRGGDMMFSYFFTRESRPYNTSGNIYNFVKVNKPVGKGGFGAWEGVLRLSTFELNSSTIKGGSVFRITPMVNWYMTKVIRIEFVYGYAILNRFGITGATSLFQSRIQFTIF